MKTRRGYAVGLVGSLAGAGVVGTLVGLIAFSRLRGLEFDALGAAIYGLIGAYAGSVIGCFMALRIAGCTRAAATAALVAVLIPVGMFVYASLGRIAVPVPMNAALLTVLLPLLAAPLAARRLVIGKGI